MTHPVQVSFPPKKAHDVRDGAFNACCALPDLANQGRELTVINETPAGCRSTLKSGEES